MGEPYMVQYRVIKIPEDLVLKIEKTMETSGLGYRTVSEFVIEAVRRRVEELQAKEVEA